MMCGRKKHGSADLFAEKDEDYDNVCMDMVGTALRSELDQRDGMDCLSDPSVASIFIFWP